MLRKSQLNPSVGVPRHTNYKYSLFRLVRSTCAKKNCEKKIAALNSGSEKHASVGFRVAICCSRFSFPSRTDKAKEGLLIVYMFCISTVELLRGFNTHISKRSSRPSKAPSSMSVRALLSRVLKVECSKIINQSRPMVNTWIK